MNDYGHENQTLLQQQHHNDLAASLLDFSAASPGDQDEFIDYLSEHVYIQLCMAGRQNEGTQDAAEQHFRSACRTVYYAEDEVSRRSAIVEAQAHLAA